MGLLWNQGASRANTAADYDDDHTYAATDYPDHPASDDGCRASNHHNAERGLSPLISDRLHRTAAA